MKSKLFLTGESGCGKSTLLRQELGKSLDNAGGFLTIRKVDENGAVKGFDIIPPDEKQVSTFLDFSKVPPIQMEAFGTLGVWCLENAMKNPSQYGYIVLDEIGGIELLEETFSEKLYQVLNSDIPCIGVIKGIGPATGMIQALGLSKAYEQKREKLWTTMKSMEDVQVVEMHSWDDEDAKQEVRKWVERWLLTK